MANAARLVKAGANAQLEGGRRSARAVRRMTEAGIPVMGHLGYTPQSANAFGRKVVRGRGLEGDELLADALALQEAGCFAIVLEAIPAELGRGSPRPSRWPPSGSAPAPRSTARCWSSPTCSA